MKKEFIDAIYANNKETEGRKKLFYDLEKKEQKQWNTLNEAGLTNWTELFVERAKTYASNIVIAEVETDTSFTYHELNLASEKIKSYILEHINDKRIGINYHNSFTFLATLIAINKTGRLAILFNNREPHMRRETLAKNAEVNVVFGDEISGLTTLNINDILNNKISNIKKYDILKTTLDDPAFVIFTSGTSGPSKPALFSHRRMVGAGVAWSLRTAMNSEDNCYISLPLYHGNALAVAFSAVIFSGATATLRPKFSVRNFWNNINKYECSHMVYIGELWRYLIKEKTEDKNPNKSLKVIFGNGLNTTLWTEVINRYNIEHVVEHFGSTEMPAGALTNWMNIAGYCGYLPPKDARLQEMVLVDNQLKPVKKQASGEALFLVPSGAYRGYLDPTLDAPKLIKDLFKKDDLWWRSGDLLQVNKEGFYTFVERLGDSYRYKGENVACVDVEEAVRSSAHVKEVVVYGITLPKIDGKIGMASLTTDEVFSPLKANQLLENLKLQLADYALPYLLRISSEYHETTSTLKIQKAHLAKKGIFDHSCTPHYLLLNGSYQALTDELFDRLLKSEIVPSAKRVQPKEIK